MPAKTKRKGWIKSNAPRNRTKEKSPLDLLGAMIRAHRAITETVGRTPVMYVPGSLRGDPILDAMEKAGTVAFERPIEVPAPVHRSPRKPFPVE